MYLPSATYRVQLNSSLTFLELKNIIGYLHRLGVSTIYASPVTKAMKGSTHGYDVSNPDLLNAEIGTEEELEEIHHILSGKYMGWLQDIVPNHMAFLCDNERIFDIMERGPESPYYRYFDIDWNHFDPVYKGKLMVPFIGKDLKEAISAGEVQLQFDDKGFRLAYNDDKYPVAIDSLSLLFSLVNEMSAKVATHLLLSKVSNSLEVWKKAKKIWLLELMEHEAILQDAVAKLNEDKIVLRNFLDHQHYIFTWYKVTDSKIDYRRFFTVNQLICLRMEDEMVFKDYHKLIENLYSRNLIQGLRIDHIDGLYNPKEYVRRLRERFGDDCYIIAEKILAYNEELARDWGIEGTSGYEFLSFVNQLLTDKKGGDKLLSFYKELVPETPAYEDVVWNKKHSFLLTQMGGELANLMHLMVDLRLFDKNEYKPEKMKEALGNLMASFPIYRIYPESYPLNKEALSIADKAFKTSGKRAVDVAEELALLRIVFYASGSEPGDDDKLLFLKRLMQFTGPLAAKGVEDTTFYVYNPLISHNEVGDAPSQLGITVAEFHDKMIRRQKHYPFSLNATSTHDTKRGEDARMRINALAAIPDEWIDEVKNWRMMNAAFIKTVKDKPAPSVNDEYFIYQSLIGAFPENLQVTDDFRNRTYAFLEKALREAKVETTYDEPDTEYEKACNEFVGNLLDESYSFLKSFLPFLNKVLGIAELYSLAQTVIKITAPGIPDVYQGCELWDISYVDPDNRRSVDYNCRKHILDEIILAEKKEAGAVWPVIQQYKKEGAEKMFATYKALNLRTSQSDLFLQGDYLPLSASHDKVMAFARMKEDRRILVVVPFFMDIISDSKEIFVSLPAEQSGTWTNIFTGHEINGLQLNVAADLKMYPVAVYTSGI